jgi:hypothetical protein
VKAGRSEGPKRQGTELEKELDENRKGAENRGATTAVTTPDPKTGPAVKPPAPDEDATRGERPANFPTESDARATDGNGRRSGSSPGSLRGGQTQRGAPGIDGMTTGGTGRALEAALGRDPRQAAEGHLCAQSGTAGGDTEAQRRDADTGHPDGARPDDPAPAGAGADADLRSGLQRTAVTGFDRGAVRTMRCALPNGTRKRVGHGWWTSISASSSTTSITTS